MATELWLIRKQSVIDFDVNSQLNVHYVPMMVLWSSDKDDKEVRSPSGLMNNSFPWVMSIVLSIVVWSAAVANLWSLAKSSRFFCSRSVSLRISCSIRINDSWVTWLVSALLIGAASRVVLKESKTVGEYRGRVTGFEHVWNDSQTKFN